jgi:predicted acyl esterase
MKHWMKKLSQPLYQIIEEREVIVPMRDEVKLSVNIFRPDAPEKFPALLAMSPYGKEVQSLPDPEIPYDFGFHGAGGVEAGKTDFWVPRGYVHVIADVRGSGISEGKCDFTGKKEQEDGYDLIEWIAQQPWCNGNVGMIGMSYFAFIQYLVAAQQPPHLKAIFACEGWTDYYRQIAYHGGMLDIGFFMLWDTLLSVHTYEMIGKRDLPEEGYNQLIDYWKNNRELKSNPRCYATLFCPEKNPPLFELLMHPYDGPYYWERSGYTMFDKIKIPIYILSRWNGWPIHLAGAFSAFLGINAPKKLKIFNTPHLRGPERPWRENHDIALRWYDHWLKGIDTGIMEEPPIEILVRGIEKVRYENEWPLARTKWTKLYLRDRGRLLEEPSTTSELCDNFINNTRWEFGEVPCVKYTTPLFEEDTEITGPITLYLNASISSTDANWMVVLKDVERNGSEELVSKGWLKASHRALDESKSKPYQPFHSHTESVPVEPGKVYEYAIEVREISYVFKRGHALQLVIKGEDTPYEDQSSPTYFHLPNMENTKHIIYHNSRYPSYLLLPIIKD